jgi:ABC-type glycerol-3-phosphate transport system substrate-binding protein
MLSKTCSRRRFFQYGALSLGAVAGSAVLAACGATPAPAATKAPEAATPASAGQAATQPPAPATTEAVATAAPAKAAAPGEVRFAMWDWYAYTPGIKWDEWNQKTAFPKFNEANPDIKVSWEPMDDFTKVLTQMSAGTAADVMSVWDPAMTVWAEKGQLLDLQPFIDKDIPNADSLYIPLAWQQMWNKFKNMRMGMLADLDITSIYYNKQAFEEAAVPLPTKDWTTDDYTAAATKLTKKDSSGNVTRWGAEIRPAFWEGYANYILAFGGQVRDDETQMKCLLDSQDAMDAIEWMRKGMFETNCFAQPNQMSASGLPSTWTGAVPAGILAMAERSADQFFSMADGMKDIPWDIAHIPQGPKGRSCMGLPDQWVIYKGVIDRNNKDAAWTFMKFLTGEWYQNQIVNVAARIPGLLSAVANWATGLRKAEPRLEKVHLETLTEQLEMGYPRGDQMFRYQAVAAEIIDPAMQQIFTEGKADAKLMKEIAPKVTAAQQKAASEAGGA